VALLNIELCVLVTAILPHYFDLCYCYCYITVLTGWWNVGVQGDDDELGSGFHLNAPGAGVAAASGFALKFWFQHQLSDFFLNLALSCTHRLNGSSSPVLMATSLYYGESKNSTPHRIKTLDPIEIKFGTVDYIRQGTRHAKFYANSSKGGFSANGWNIRKKIFFIYAYFSFAHPQVRPLKGFLRLIRQTMRFCTRKCLFGIRKLKFDI